MRAIPLTSCLKYAARFNNSGVFVGSILISAALAFLEPGNMKLMTALNLEVFFFAMVSVTKLSIAVSSSCPVRRQFALMYDQQLT